jgi:hypothetical protein
MSLVANILATYRAPRHQLRRLLDMGQREDRVLIYLMLACALIFVAQWPRLSREAYLDPEIPLDARLGGALLGLLFLAPLALYGMAALTRLIAGVLGGSGSWYSSRLALFWSLLAAAPLWLLNGLVVGFAGPGLASNLTGAVALAAFVIFWALALLETETHKVPA